MYPLCTKIEAYFAIPSDYLPVAVGLLIPVAMLFSDVARVCSLSLVIKMYYYRVV